MLKEGFMPKFDLMQRPLSMLALLAAGTMAGLILAPSGAGSQDAALVEQYAAALETRIAGLERLLMTHVGADSAGPPRDGGVILKAPFKIVDASNRVIFSVAEDRGGGTVSVTGAGGRAAIMLEGAEDRVRLAGQKGRATLGADPSGCGVVIMDVGGTVEASVNKSSSGDMGLRVYERGVETIYAGNTAGTGGTVKVFSPSRRYASVTMASNSDGSGTLFVAETSDNKGIALDGQDSRVTIESSKGTAYLGNTDGAWGLELGDLGGTPLAQLSKADAGMALRIFEDGQQAAAMGYLPGSGGQLRLLSSGTIAVSAGAVHGDGVVEVYNAGVPAAGMMGDKSQVAVFSESGQPVALLRISQSGGGGTVEATDLSGSPVFRGGYLPSGPGAACVVHNGTKCLGIGLTGMEGFR
jgi:hypothetical protein